MGNDDDDGDENDVGAAAASADDNSEVVFYKVENGGHTWPGSEYLIPGDVTNLDFNASEVIWKFFCPESSLLGINNIINDTEINVFPNPSTSFVNIELKENNKLLKVQVYQINGQLVLQENKFKIDISSLEQGIYFLKISTQKGISNQRIFKF